jgi:peptidoglycan/xylan/chitin deacetylase (PgdA/CDA1 family)
MGMGQRRQSPSPSPANRRAFLRGMAVTGGAAALVAGGAGRAAAARDHGTRDRLAATAPPWPDPDLTELRLVWRVPTERRAIALTFDDGPDPRWTPRILDLLAEAGAHATFFCCGEPARLHPELVQRAARLGEVGNHSWSHADLATLNTAPVDRELDQTHQLLASITGQPPTLFRPPYGNLRGAVLQAAARHGYRAVLWSDMVQHTASAPGADTTRLLAHAAPGQILLAHDGRGDRARVLARLPALLHGLRSDGFELTTVSDLLGLGDGLGDNPEGTLQGRTAQQARP